MVAALFLCSACNDEWDDHYKDKGINPDITLYDAIKAVFREVFALSTQARHIFIKKTNPIFKRIDTRFSPAPS